MPEQFSILRLAFPSGPDVECRAILSSITGAHIGGFPLHVGEEHTVVALQRLPARVQKHFGEVPHVILEPKLQTRSSGWLASPKVEHIGFFFAAARSQALVVVWYESDAEPLMCAENRRRFEQLGWDSLAKNVVYGAAQA
jgi:hypothetical protein